MYTVHIKCKEKHLFTQTSDTHLQMILFVSMAMSFYYVKHCLSYTANNCTLRRLDKNMSSRPWFLVNILILMQTDSWGLTIIRGYLKEKHPQVSLNQSVWNF